MKKKLLSLVLVLTMCLGLAVPAFAEDAEEEEEDLSGYKAISVVTEEAVHVDQPVDLYQSVPALDILIPNSEGHLTADWFRQIGPDTAITVTNNSPDPEAYIYIYLQRFLYCAEPMMVRTRDVDTGEMGEIEMQGHYWGNGNPICLRDVYRKEMPGTENDRYAFPTVSAADGLYWEELESLDSSGALYMAKLLYSGDSVTFTLPEEDPAEDIFYRLVVAIHYPEENNTYWGWNFYKYNSSVSTLATPTSATVLVNGQDIAFDAYNIGGANYFKLRDLAWVLTGTDKQFEVSYDTATKNIALLSGERYTMVGGEMSTSSVTGVQNASTTPSTILLDGEEISLTAYLINGSNYFMLRDIGQLFDFGIGWDAGSRTITIDTSTGYTAG